MLDAAEVRRKLLQLKNKGQGSNPHLFKPVEGKQVIRIVPNSNLPESSLPFEELYFHYFTGKPILSPLSYGEADPIDEFYRDLTKGGKLPREEWEKIKQFKPQMRTYAPIVIREKEKEGVRFWAFGKTVYLRLLEIINEPDYGDISDPKNGHDLTVTYIPKEKSDTHYAKTDILVRPKETPLHTDATLVQKLLSDQPRLIDTFEHHSYDALKKLLADYLDDPFGGDDAEPEPTPEDFATSPTAETASDDNQTLSSELEQQFDSLFDEKE